MRFTRSLRFRVTVSYAALAGGLALITAVALYFGALDAGQRLMDQTLSAETQDYQARRARNPRSLPPATATLLGYISPAGSEDPPLPETLASETPGRRDVTLAGVPYRLAVTDRGGARYYLLHNATLLRERQAQLGYTLAGFVLLMAVLSAAIAYTLAERVIEPVKELARRVREIGRAHV
jgi:hypothetical protein